MLKTIIRSGLSAKTILKLPNWQMAKDQTHNFDKQVEVLKPMRKTTQEYVEEELKEKEDVTLRDLSLISFTNLSKMIAKTSNTQFLNLCLKDNRKTIVAMAEKKIKKLNKNK